MSYKIYERQYADGAKFIARVKLPDGKWRNYPTYQTDPAKAEKVAQRIVNALLMERNLMRLDILAELS